MYKAVKIGNNYSLPKEVIRKYYKYVYEPFVQPVLTSNGVAGGDNFAAFASGEWNTNTPAWKAFDGVKDDLFNAWIARTYSPAWLGCYNPMPLNLYGVYFTNTYECPTAGIIQVSNDGVTWTDAQSYTNSNTTLGATWYVQLAAPVTNVKYVRNYITEPVGGIPRIAEMELDATERTVTEGTSSDYDFYKDVDVYKAIEQ